MPCVSVWADDLRGVFGVEEFNAGLRQFGYFASENGRTIDTRKLTGGTEIDARQMVIRPLLDPNTKAGHGR